MLPVILPHYFVLDTDQFEEIGTLASVHRQSAIWKTRKACRKLFNGEIDCPVSDHSPCPPEMKPATSWKHGAVLPYAKLYGRDVG